MGKFALLFAHTHIHTEIQSYNLFRENKLIEWYIHTCLWNRQAFSDYLNGMNNCLREYNYVNIFSFVFYYFSPLSRPHRDNVAADYKGGQNSSIF